MTTLLRVGVAFALAGCIAGCAIQPSTAPSAVVTARRMTLIAADRVKDAVAIGKSTRADVIAALGGTLVISFDNGYEIWVYRLVNDAPAKETLGQHISRMGSRKAERETTAEFVILFAPSGLVAKTRIRPALQRVSAS